MYVFTSMSLCLATTTRIVFVVLYVLQYPKWLHMCTWYDYHVERANSSRHHLLSLCAIKSAKADKGASNSSCIRKTSVVEFQGQGYYHAWM